MTATPTTGTAPGRRMLVITKPDYPVMRIGPLAPGTARDWAHSLNLWRHQAPEGTRIENVPFDATAMTGFGVTPDEIPRTTDALVHAMAFEVGNPKNGGWPDLYDRLQLVHGTTRAGAMWSQACKQIDAEEAEREGAQQASGDLAEAAKLLTDAEALARQARGKILRAIDRADQMELAILPPHSGVDARDHAGTAGRELRAALRALGAEI